jgi:hypothetical protein
MTGRPTAPIQDGLAWIRQPLTLLAVPRLATSGVRPQHAKVLGGLIHTSTSGPHDGLRLSRNVAGSDDDKGIGTLQVRGPVWALVPGSAWSGRRGHRVAVQHVRERGPHRQDQDRQAGHDGGNGPRRAGYPCLLQQVAGDLPGAAEREGEDRGTAGRSGVSAG